MTQHNEVSTFEAGFRAGMIAAGVHRREVDIMFSNGLELKSMMIETMNHYNKEVSVEQATAQMEDWLQSRKDQNEQKN